LLPSEKAKLIECSYSHRAGNSSNYLVVWVVDKRGSVLKLVVATLSHTSSMNKIVKRLQLASYFSLAIGITAAVYLG